jgi:glycosyltransferase involved in cell wall biosynthesis
MTDLSILICTLPQRAALLARLMDVLTPQVCGHSVEILTAENAGELSIGEKRQRLLSRSDGQYVCFVDDDDLVPDSYVSRILEATQGRPDVVGMYGTMTTNGRNPQRFILSRQFDHWFEQKGIYYRPPNHVCPVRRELALQVGYKSISFGEDKDYSDRLFPLLQTEHFISDIPMYSYLFVSPDQRRGR